MSEPYRSRIDRLIKEMTGELVLNGSPEHATVIVERMLANAATDVSILTRRFDPRIYGTEETVAQARLCLGDSNRSIEILIEQVNAETLSQHPFVVGNKPAIEAGNLKFRALHPEWASNVAFNFAVMDDNGYRFERDKTEPVATAAFGQTDFVARLRTIFANLWNASAPISLPAA